MNSGTSSTEGQPGHQTLLVHYANPIRTTCQKNLVWLGTAQNALMRTREQRVPGLGVRLGAVPQ